MTAKSAALSKLQHAGDTTKKIWLTFDDGPHPRYTEAILEVLKTKRKSATFFVLGSRVNQVGTGLLRRALNEGHRIGNHSFSHRCLTKLSLDDVRQEIASTETLIADFLGSDKLFRPPYGRSNSTVDQAISELGYRKTLWTVDTLDWIRASESDCWVRHGVELVRCRTTAIVLAHDIHEATADHLADFIDRVERLGAVTFESCDTL
jgi:peptidoglycan/xylan/chitin deacetylase (PgdA/CDA1 family)